MTEQLAKAKKMFMFKKVKVLKIMENFNRFQNLLIWLKMMKSYPIKTQNKYNILIIKSQLQDFLKGKHLKWPAMIMHHKTPSQIIYKIKMKQGLTQLMRVNLFSKNIQSVLYLNNQGTLNQSFRFLKTATFLEFLGKKSKK